MQPPEGQACLAWTIRNRMDRSGWSAEAVAFQQWQYLIWERDVVAPDYGLRLRWLTCEAWGQFPDNPWCMEPVLTIGSSEYWWRTWSLAAMVYFGTGSPPEGCEGVENYDNLAAFWDGKDPPWVADYEVAAVYGDHTFYRPKGVRDGNTGNRDSIGGFREGGSKDHLRM